MSKKTNPTLIGGFVIGALVLVATGIALFGGAQLFAERNFYVAYFVEDTKGLRVGSNILMNGVRVGHVSEIALLVDALTYDTTTRVTLEIFPDTFIQTQEGVLVGEGMQVILTHDELIYDAGLRARLELESFVTGQLLVELSLRPETNAILRSLDPPYPEIPTIPSNIQEILAKVQDWIAGARENVDLGELAQRISSIIRGLDELTNSPDLRESLSGINSLVNDDDTQRLTASLQSALDEMRGAAASANRMFSEANVDFNVLAEDLKPILERASGAVAQAEQTLAAANEQLRGDSEEALQLQATLSEIERAARTLGDFFDYLERNPEALLRGKQQ